MPEPITSLIAAAAAKKGLASLFESIGKSKTLKNAVDKWKTKKELENIAENLAKVRMVKTIWQMLKPVDLHRFYYPMAVSLQGRVIRPVLISDFNDRHVIIKGYIGIGKSLMLRYLASREASAGQSIPIFIELRSFNSETTLLNLVLSECKNLGLKSISLDLLEEMMAEGHVSLFLDAFDECADSLQPALSKEIGEISRRYPETSVFVTSRPNSPIMYSRLFSVWNVEELKPDEYEKVIRKIHENEAQANLVIARLSSDESEVRQLLRTPLMVALFMTHFRMEEDLPTNEVGLFENLFDLMSVRHDRFKAGFRRERKCSLSDAKLRQVFDCVSYLTRKSSKTSWKESELVAVFESALLIRNLGGEAEAALFDVCNVTNLILKEGMQLQYVHKSVQEYHSAAFIAQQSDENAEVFYTNARVNWRKWEQELRFLKQIDRERFFDKFIGPDSLSALFNAASVDHYRSYAREIPETPDELREVIDNMFGDSQIFVRLETSSVEPFLVFQDYVHQPRNFVGANADFEKILRDLLANIDLKNANPASIDANFEGSDMHIPLSQVLFDGLVEDAEITAVEPIVRAIWHLYEESDEIAERVRGLGELFQD